MLTSFIEVSFKHIYREINTLVDGLSKKVIGGPKGTIIFVEYKYDILVATGTIRTY